MATAVLNGMRKLATVAVVPSEDEQRQRAYAETVCLHLNLDPDDMYFSGETSDMRMPLPAMRLVNPDFATQVAEFPGCAIVYQSDAMNPNQGRSYLSIKAPLSHRISPWALAVGVAALVAVFGFSGAQYMSGETTSELIARYWRMFRYAGPNESP